MKTLESITIECYINSHKKTLDYVIYSNQFQESQVKDYYKKVITTNRLKWHQPTKDFA